MLVGMGQSRMSMLEPFAAVKDGAILGVMNVLQLLRLFSRFV